MLKKTLIHLVALFSGVAIVVCLTITARTLRESEPVVNSTTSFYLQSSLQCYNCTDQVCSNSSVINCNGSCVKMELLPKLLGKLNNTFWYRFCGRDIIDLDECPQSYYERFEGLGFYVVKSCHSCGSDLCNK